MRTIYSGYTQITAEDPVFFAGANTGRGFVGIYPALASEEKRKRVWILKGGSGTGKSTLMRKLRSDATADGIRCRQYLCSSDPASLDALVMGEDWVILDGTAPHVWEMQYPGAASELVDLGKYWKREVLENRREEIASLTRQKEAAYRAAYRFLGALSLLEEEHRDTVRTLLDQEKMDRFLERLLRRVPKGQRTGGKEVCRTWACTMKGLYRTDGLARLAENHWRVEDCYQTAVCFLTLLAERCAAMDIPAAISQHPVNDRITEVYIPSLSLHIALEGDTPDKTICMRRFVQKELLEAKKGMLRLGIRCMHSLMEDVCGYLAEAGRQHGALEEIYREAMDFARLNRETGILRKQIREYMARV